MVQQKPIKMENKNGCQSLQLFCSPIFFLGVFPLFFPWLTLDRKTLQRCKMKRRRWFQRLSRSQVSSSCWQPGLWRRDEWRFHTFPPGKMCGVLAGFHAVEYHMNQMHARFFFGESSQEMYSHRYPKLGHIWKFRYIFQGPSLYLIYIYISIYVKVSNCHAKKTTSWMPCWTSNRCSTRQSAPLRLRRLCRTAAGQLEQRREAQRRRRAECEAMARGWGWMGEILSWRRCFLWWFFVNCLRLIFVWWFWIFGLFLRLCWLVLKSCLFRFDFLIYIIWRNFERLGRWAQQQQNFAEPSKNHCGRQTSSCSKHFSIDRRPPFSGTTSQSVKSGNLFLLKQTLAALEIFSELEYWKPVEMWRLTRGCLGKNWTFFCVAGGGEEAEGRISRTTGSRAEAPESAGAQHPSCTQRCLQGLGNCGN